MNGIGSVRFGDGCWEVSGSDLCKPNFISGGEWVFVSLDSIGLDGRYWFCFWHCI